MPIKLMFWIGWVPSGWYVQQLCVFILIYIYIYVCVCAFNNAFAKVSMCNPSHVCVYVCMLVLCMVPLHHLDMCRLWWLLMFLNEALMMIHSADALCTLNSEAKVQTFIKVWSDSSCVFKLQVESVFYNVYRL